MSAITDLLVGTSYTTIVTTGLSPLILFNASDEAMELLFGGTGATLTLHPGQARRVLVEMAIAARCSSGGKTMKVLRGIDLVNGASAVPLSYDAATGSELVWLLNPAWSRQNPDTLVEATGMADDTHPYFVDFAGYRYGVFQIEQSCTSGSVVTTIEASAEDNGTSDLSADYDDVTQALFGVATLTATAGTAKAFWAITVPFVVKYLKLNSVIAGGLGSGAVKCHFRGQY